MIAMALDIKISDAARDRLKKIVSEQKLEGKRLRLAIKGGGCSGFNYDLSFTDKTDKFDKLDEVNGIPIAIDGKSYIFLRGLTLDYVETLMQSGFVFQNPNAKSTCGCGTSFSL